MKKTIFSLALSALALSGIAQDNALKQYGFWDNWYIQLQGGGSYLFSEYSKDADFLDLVSPHAALSVGKHFSHIYGARVQFAGWESKTPSLFKSTDTRKINYVQGSLDGLVNLTNLFTTFNGEKGFNLYLIGGATYLRRLDNNGYTTANIIAPRAGLQADVRLNNALSLNLEANANFLADRFNARYGGEPHDISVNALLGLTYRFDKSGFELADGIDLSQITSLNDKINGLNQQLKQKDTTIGNLQAELAKKPTAVVEKIQGETTREVVLNSVVVFRLGSAALEQNQEINILNAAKYLQENPSVNVLVTGYADKQTGTPKINQELSEKRAKAVADILTSKYKIAASRITTEASGDKDQPFEKNDWNRVVIFTAK